MTGISDWLATISDWLKAHPGTLVSPGDTWTIWAVILVLVAASIYLEQTYSWADKISGPVLGLLVAMFLSTCRVMPAESPPYDVASDYLAPLAIPLLLLRANLIKIARETGKMLVAFQLATLGTIIGAVIATLLMHTLVPRCADQAGIMSASYIGGMINFVAVAKALNVGSDLTNPLIVADNVVMAGFFVLLQWIAGSPWFRKHFPHPHSVAADPKDEEAPEESLWRRKEISLLDLAKVFAYAGAVTACAMALARLFDARLPEGNLRTLLANKYVMTTFLSVTVATLVPRWLENMPGAQEVGSYLLLIFLVVIGFPADLLSVLFKAPLMFLFCLIIAVPNVVVTLALGKVLRLNLEDCLLASNASLGGPATAATMAVSRGWHKLALPGLLIGLWGYATGTVIGVAVARALIAWLGTE